MCQFGDETKIIAELDLTEKEALRGWRNNYVINSFNKKEKFLKSLNQYIWHKNDPATGNPSRLNSEGIYNYNYNSYYNSYYNNYNNNNYNYNNNNYNYNHYNNNNYNYNHYNNNNYNHYNNNNYNYNYNYYIQVATILYGKVFKYNEGYRSQFCKPTHLVILDKDSNWFTNQNTVKFANHFNSIVEQLAKEYNCETIEWSKRDQVK